MIIQKNDIENYFYQKKGGDNQDRNGPVCIRTVQNN